MMRVVLVILLALSIANARKDTEDGHGTGQMRVQDTRKDLTWGIAETPTSLHKSAMGFCAGLPRGHVVLSGETVKSLPAGIKWSAGMDSAEIEKVQGYFDSMGAAIVFCIICAALSMLSCLLFCTGRSRDHCGGRRAVTQYSRKDVWFHRGLILLFLVVTTIIFGIAFSANGSSSIAVDQLFVKATAVVDEVYAFRAVTQNMADLTMNTLQTFQMFNQTLALALPTAVEIPVFIQCVNSSFPFLQGQKTFVQSLDPDFNATVKLRGIGIAARQLPVMENSLRNNLLPNFNTLQTNLQNFNASIATSVPDLDGAAAQAIQIDSCFTRWAPIPTVRSALQDMDSRAATLNGTEISNVWQAAQNAYATLPNMTQLAIEVSGTGVLATVRARLVQLQSATQAFPSTSLLNTVTNRLHVGVQAFTTAAALITEVTNIRTAIVDVQTNNMPNLANLQVALLAVQNFRNAKLPITMTGMQQVGQGDGLVETLGLAAIVHAIEDVNAGVALVASINLTATAERLNNFQATLPQLRCLKTLLDHFELCNATLYSFPNASARLFEHKPQIDRLVNKIRAIQRTMVAGASALRWNFTTALASLPDTAQLYAVLKNATDALTDGQDLHRAYMQIVNLNASLTSFPGVVSQYNSALTALNGAMSIPELSHLEANLTILTSALSGLPSTAAFVANAAQLSAALTPGLQSAITAGIAAIDAGPPQYPFQPNVRTPLQAGVASVSTALAGQPNATALSVGLQNVESALSAFPNIPTLNSQLLTLQNAVTATPSIPALKSATTSIRDSYNGLNEVRLLSNTNNLALFSQRVALIMPGSLNVNATAAALLPVEAIRNLTGIEETVDDLAQRPDDYWDQGDQIQAYQRLAEQSVFRNDVKGVDETSLASFQNHSDKFTGMNSRVQNQRNNFVLQRNKAKRDFVDTYDKQRLLLFDGFLILPMILALLGGCSCIFRKGGIAMCAALTIFPVMALLFLMAGLQLPIAIFFADHCPEFDTNMRVQLGSLNISKELFGNIVPITNDVKTDELFNYLTSCGGSEPELLQAMGNADNFVAASGVNFTTEFSNVLNNKANVTVVPSIVAALDTLGSAQSRFTDIAESLRPSIRCDQIGPRWVEFREELCYRFGGAVALSTAVYFWFALFMIPGIIIFVRGYKRFNPYNSADAADLPGKDQPEVFDEYDFEDPDQIVLDEKEAGLHHRQQHAAAARRRSSGGEGGDRGRKESFDQRQLDAAIAASMGAQNQNQNDNNNPAVIAITPVEPISNNAAGVPGGPSPGSDQGEGQFVPYFEPAAGQSQEGR